MKRRSGEFFLPIVMNSIRCIKKSPQSYSLNTIWLPSIHTVFGTEWDNKLTVYNYYGDKSIPEIFDDYYDLVDIDEFQIYYMGFIINPIILN